MVLRRSKFDVRELGVRDRLDMRLDLVGEYGLMPSVM
jgi:hypothetical protein